MAASARLLCVWLLCFSHRLRGARSVRRQASTRSWAVPQPGDGSSLESSAFDLTEFQKLVAPLGDALRGEAGECGNEEVAGMLDFRRCWGRMVDFADQPVCGPEVMGAFAQSVEAARPESVAQSSGGKSGATVITSFWHFIVKRVDRAAVENLALAAPAVAEAIAWREENSAGCWSSGLAPICAVLRGSGEQYWQVMRKVTLEDGAERQRVSVRGSSVDYLDLKGPLFTVGYNDGWAKRAQNFSDYEQAFAMVYSKERMEEEGNFWRHKDLGFKEAFPRGISLRDGDASRGAQIAFVQDAQFLAEEELTDYSLFVAFFKPSPDGDCSADASKPPRFPVVLHATAAKGYRFRMAIGVIDWIEGAVNDKYFVKDYSTMRSPGEYKNIFSRMWGFYFHVIPQSTEPTGVCRPRCQFDSPGAVVTAIEHMQWRSQGKGKLALQRHAQISPSAELKVFAGETGRFVRKLSGNLVLVRWDSMPEHHLPARVTQVASGPLEEDETGDPDQVTAEDETGDPDQVTAEDEKNGPDQVSAEDEGNHSEPAWEAPSATHMAGPGRYPVSPDIFFKLAAGGTLSSEEWAAIASGRGAT